MIDEIQVENLALIEQARFEPCPGLTVITGETGAGKTALLSSLRLLMGARADKSEVRDGQSQMKVCARFFGSLPGVEPSDEGPSEDLATCDELVVSRSVSADGRSRVQIDGAMGSVRQLQEYVAPRIDLCSQHEHQRLLDSSVHLDLLDDWARAEVAPAKEAYRQAFDAAHEAAAELKRIQEQSRVSDERLDQMRFTLRRIEQIRPEPGEYERLSDLLDKAEHAESLAKASSGAYEALSADGGALESLNTAIFALEDGARFDSSLSAYAASLREAAYVLEDVSRDALRYLDGVEFDAEQLAYQQERMSELQSLMRLYGPRMDDVFAAWERAADAVALADGSGELEEAARAKLDQAEERLARAARELAAIRAKAAPAFDKAVSAQMARLEMGSACLVSSFTELDRAKWTRRGSQSFEFLFQSGSGMRARPLGKIASGGEISRVMLAIKVALGSADAVETLVFDEIDAGVGGSAAVALADVLTDLARTHQVIVVTHLAQIAVAGQAHYLVSKTPGDVPRTALVRLDDRSRVHEIARMLSGSATEASLAHARELLGQDAG